MNVSSAQIFSNVFHVFGNFMSSQLPLKADTVEELGVLLFLQFRIPCSLNIPSPVWNWFYFFAFYTLELRVRVLSRIEVCTLRMDPPCALLTHDPLLAVVSFVKINLFTVNTEGVFMELLLAARTECFWAYLLRLLFGWLVMIFTDFIGTSCKVLKGFGVEGMMMIG